jgi:hypothetical protein
MPDGPKNRVHRPSTELASLGAATVSYNRSPKYHLPFSRSWREHEETWTGIVMVLATEGYHCIGARSTDKFP